MNFHIWILSAILDTYQHHHDQNIILVNFDWEIHFCLRSARIWATLYHIISTRLNTAIIMAPTRLTPYYFIDVPFLFNKSNKHNLIASLPSSLPLTISL